MKSLLKLTSLFLVCVLFLNGTVADSFEGKIYFRYLKPNSKEIYVYYIKGEKVRIDQILDGKIEATTLVNTQTKEMYAISPTNKLYIKKQYKPVDYSRKSDVAVEKTGKKLTIQGVDCEEVKVKNETSGTELTYYVNQKNWDFFRPLLECLNRKEAISTHYFQVEGLTRDFPLLGIQKNASGMQTHRLEVTLLAEEKLDDTWFDIPYNFTETKY